MPDIELDLDENIIWIGEAGFDAHHDKVIILQDDYRSGLECQTCLDESKHTVAGREVSTIACEDCGGSGRRLKVGNDSITVKCGGCDGAGWKICPDCNGKGGNIVLPESQKGRPMSGTIVSVGPKATLWKRGEKCLYPSFAGHAYDLKAKTRAGKTVDAVLLIIREDEILVRMHGRLEQNTVKKSMALHTNA